MQTPLHITFRHMELSRPGAPNSPARIPARDRVVIPGELAQVLWQK